MTALATSAGPSRAASPSSPSTPAAQAAQPVKRRRYARRSCLNCRSKKARCELPDELVASSHDPLPVYKACHRCRALDIACVVWDGDRKRKPRLGPSSTSSSTAQSTNHSPLLSVGANDPTDLLSNQHHDSRRSDLIDSHDAATRRLRDSYAVPLSNGSPSSHRHDRSGSWASLSRDDSHARQPSASHTSLPAPSKASRAHQRTASSASSVDPANTRYDAALFSGSIEGANGIVIDREIQILTNRFMHSPLVTLNRFITKIPSFSRLLRPDTDRSFDGNLSDLLTDENILELQPHIPILRMWHPHIPDLNQLRAANRQSHQSLATSLLLATVCLVASKIAGRRHLAKHFAIHVDRLGLQALVAAPKHIHAAQAFELLLAHDPSLIGASFDSASVPSTQSAVFGESLHSSALSIAEAIGLDLVMSQSHHHHNPAANNQANGANSHTDDSSLRWQLQRFSLWCSLSLWRATFVFLNSTIRAQDFSQLSRDAQLAITLVDQLESPRTPSSQHDDSTTNDETLFKAGILALAYRAIHVAEFNTRMARIETFWHSRSIFSAADIRHEVHSRIKQNIHADEELKKAKRRRLWSLANLPELRLLDRWIDLHIESNWTIMQQLYMRSVFPDCSPGDTLLDMARVILDDPGLYRFCSDASQATYLRAEGVLAGVAASPRFEAQRLEQTGLPLLLTCGFILHITISLMEALNYVQYGLNEVALREDMFALILARLAERLVAPKEAEHESLERLVSGLLVQMSRRLSDSEYLRVTRSAASEWRPDATQQPVSVDACSVGSHGEVVRNDGAQPNAVNGGVASLAAIPVSWLPTSQAALPQTQLDHLGSAAASTDPLAASAASLLGTADAMSAENMAHIMDQILNWDAKPNAAVAEHGH